MAQLPWATTHQCVNILHMEKRLNSLQMIVSFYRDVDRRCQQSLFPPSGQVSARTRGTSCLSASHNMAGWDNPADLAAPHFLFLTFPLKYCERNSVTLNPSPSLQLQLNSSSSVRLNPVQIIVLIHICYIISCTYVYTLCNNRSWSLSVSQGGIRKEKQREMEQSKSILQKY